MFVLFYLLAPTSFICVICWMSVHHICKNLKPHSLDSEWSLSSLLSYWCLSALSCFAEVANFHDHFFSIAYLFPITVSSSATFLNRTFPHEVSLHTITCYSDISLFWDWWWVLWRFFFCVRIYFPRLKTTNQLRWTLRFSPTYQTHCIILTEPEEQEISNK